MSILNTKYIHYTDKHLILETREYTQSFSSKPDGLWVSVETPDGSEIINWQQWCIADDFDLCQLRNMYQVSLKSDNNILYLATPDDVKVFGNNYRLGRDNPYAINWERVARQYAGVVITPYFWCLRHVHDVSWYYTWDCASGCIWDFTEIDRIEYLGENDNV